MRTFSIVLNEHYSKILQYPLAFAFTFNMTTANVRVALDFVIVQIFQRSFLIKKRRNICQKVDYKMSEGNQIFCTFFVIAPIVNLLANTSCLAHCTNCLPET